jgi:GPI mannosyltransferase 3
MPSPDLLGGTVTRTRWGELLVPPAPDRPSAGTWPGLGVVVVVGLALRLAFAFVATNLHHPDELFQYLEPAHRLVFGYGLVPWEYRFGTRSWLLPLVLSGPLYLVKLVHADDPALYAFVIKSLLCVLAVSLVVSCYRIGRNLVSESAGRLAAVLACFWHELLYFAPRATPETLATYLLAGALALVTDVQRGRRALLFGLCVGLAVVLRLQYLPVAAFLLLLAFGAWNVRAVTRSVVAALGVGVLAGVLDKLTWGGWFISYYNTYVFNVVLRVAGMFGTSPWRTYAVQLGITSAGVFLIVIVASLLFIRRLWILLGFLVAIVGVHTIIQHKEYRFIFAAIPVLLVMTAVVTVLVAERLRPALARLAPAAVVAGLALVSTLGTLGLLPREVGVYQNLPLFRPRDEIRAFLFLNRQTDLAGILLKDLTLWDTGGYYYLHRDVPLYAQEHEPAMSQDGRQGPRAYASHIVCPASAGEIDGFAPVARFGAIEVRKQLAPAAPYSVLAAYTHDVPQPGIDGVYTPSVRTPFQLDPAR